MPFALVYRFFLLSTRYATANLSFKKKALPTKEIVFFLLAQVFFLKKKEKVLGNKKTSPKIFKSFCVFWFCFFDLTSRFLLRIEVIRCCADYDHCDDDADDQSPRLCWWFYWWCWRKCWRWCYRRYRRRCSYCWRCR